MLSIDTIELYERNMIDESRAVFSHANSLVVSALAAHAAADVPRGGAVLKVFPARCREGGYLAKPGTASGSRQPLDSLVMRGGAVKSDLITKLPDMPESQVLLGPHLGA